MYILASDKGIATETYDGVVFGDNLAKQSGGALFNNGSNGTCNPLIINSMFVNNNSDTYGGAMFNFGKRGDASPTIINTIFTLNKAFSGGALYCLGSEFGKSNPNIINCNIVQNIANNGGGINFNASDFSGTSSGSIINTIIYFNSAVEGPNIRSILSSPKISYSIIQAANCTALQNGNGSNIACGVGMIYNQNPMFLDTAKVDYHLLKNSVAIGKGFLDSITSHGIINDFYSSPRTVGSKIDIGASENQENVAVLDMENDDSFQIFPNPTTKYIYIKTDFELINKDFIEVLDINGKLIKNSFIFENNLLDIGDLKSGVYILKLNTATSIKTQKLIKL
jgi:Secretion system C-terminal sorting domain